jgi:protease-4
MGNESREQPVTASIVSGSTHPSEADRGRAGVSTPPPIIIQQGGSHFLFRLVASLGWLGFFFCGLLLLIQFAVLGEYFDTSEGITEKHHSLSKFSRDKVAIISVQGVIMNGEGFVRHQIDRVRNDKRIKAIVLRVDSPGGTVTGADYIYHHLKQLREERRIPLVVSMGSLAASGGYYVAMAVGDQPKSIYAEPTTTTGSIGVIVPHYDLSGLLERFNVKDDSIASHPRKEMLSMTKAMPEDQRKLVQAYVGDAFQRFKQVVKEGRPAFRKNDQALDQLATGEIYTASQAVKNGLVDEVGFLEAAIDRAIELAGLDRETTRVVKFEQPFSLFDLGVVRSRAEVSPWASVLESSVPRAFYLWTTLPPLMTSSFDVLRQ